MNPFTPTLHCWVAVAQCHVLTDVVAQCHVAGDVHTGGLLVSGQQAPVSKVTQGGGDHGPKQQHQHLHPRKQY